MSKNSGFGKFLLGAAVGLGLGILFAPKKGSETRKDLKEKLDELVEKIKDIDKEELKVNFDKKIKKLKSDLADLDKEKVLKVAKEKGEKIVKEATNLVNMAIEAGKPVVQDAAEKVRVQAVKVTKEILKKLEKEEESV